MTRYIALLLLITPTLHADTTSDLRDALADFKRRESAEPVSAPTPKETPAPDPAPERVTPPLPKKAPEETYDQAYQRALRERKPLIIWVGGNFCPT